MLDKKDIMIAFKFDNAELNENFLNYFKITVSSWTFNYKTTKFHNLNKFNFEKCTT